MTPSTNTFTRLKGLLKDTYAGGKFKPMKPGQIKPKKVKIANPKGVKNNFY